MQIARDRRLVRDEVSVLLCTQDETVEQSAAAETFDADILAPAEDAFADHDALEVHTVASIGRLCEDELDAGEAADAAEEIDPAELAERMRRLERQGRVIRIASLVVMVAVTAVGGLVVAGTDWSGVLPGGPIAAPGAQPVTLPAPPSPVEADTAAAPTASAGGSNWVVAEKDERTRLDPVTAVRSFGN